ncbi:MAG TPA: Lrp/AsnC family transcriptional regulator [Caulobacteraceae bacterium]|jgi:DNA-binding Lrp family transcriptional regulator
MTDIAPPDRLDLQIIEALRANPLTTNKAMARRFGVAEPTVASRIRNMAERGAMRVTVQRDLAALGFNVFAFLDIYSDGRPAAEIATDLMAIEQLTSVVSSLGGPELLVNAYAQTHASLQLLVEGPLASTPGIRRVELHVCLETIKHLAGYGNLSKSISDGLAAPTPEDIDEAIIALLAMDGRRSNRDIARQLDLSEGTIRQRLRRMTEGKIISRGVVCDPAMIGQTISAIARMWVDPAHASALASALCESSACFFAAKTAGQFNFIALFVTDTLEAVEAALASVTAQAAGALAIDVKVITRSFKHRYDLANLV